jgi:predicted short-subunit dehydrogenase-like oxidoreductase (DUF2520 family)
MRELERDSQQSVEIAPQPVAIIGAGRVGRSIARAAAGAGIEVSLGGRRNAVESCELAEVALLCVPDGTIRKVCETIAVAVPPLRLVGHVSGATPLAALDAARERGARTFSMHPLQTIPDGGTPLEGMPCAVTGSSPAAGEAATSLVQRLGMRPFLLAEGDRATYHAAASVASNFLVALEECAAELIERAGIEAGRELLAPLVLRTAENWAELGADALTGPIARGDEATVQRHLEAIAEAAPELLELYRALAERTRALAEGASPPPSPSGASPAEIVA